MSGMMYMIMLMTMTIPDDHDHDHDDSDDDHDDHDDDMSNVPTHSSSSKQWTRESKFMQLQSTAWFPLCFARVYLTNDVLNSFSQREIPILHSSNNGMM